MSTLISCAQTAKLIRTALKEAFPDVKFSVRSSTYSGGASINVRWTDGPNDAQVSPITHTFQGSYFDGSIDYKGSRFAMIDGLRVSFGADSVFTKRQYSRAACERAAERVRRRYGDKALDDARIKGTDEYGFWIYDSDMDRQRLFGEVLRKYSDRLKVLRPANATGH